MTSSDEVRRAIRAGVNLDEGELRALIIYHCQHLATYNAPNHRNSFDELEPRAARVHQFTELLRLFEKQEAR